jgi:hypothetical protein
MSNDNTTPSKLSRIIAFDPRGIHPKVRVPVLKSIVTMLFNMRQAPLANGRVTLSVELDTFLANCERYPECRFFFFLSLEEDLSFTTHISETAVSDAHDIKHVHRFTGFGDEKKYVVERYTDPIKWFKAGLALGNNQS